MTPRRPCIAVVGDGTAPPGSAPWLAAEELGEALVGAGFRVLTGGLGGVMEAASRGARRSPSWRDGDCVALLPGHEATPANAFVDLALATGLDHARNVLVAHADAVVAVGGGAGTLSEIALAWVHRRLVVALRAGGWSERLAGRPLDDRPRFGAIADDRVFAAAGAAEAVAILRARLPEYAAARTGEAELAAIDALRARDAAASRAFDADGLAELWTEDAVVLAPGQAPVRGKDAIRRQLAAAPRPEVLEYEQAFEETLVLGGIAIEWGSIRGAERPPGGGEPARSRVHVMRLLKRQPDGSWRVHRSIFAPAPEE